MAVLLGEKATVTVIVADFRSDDVEYPEIDTWLVFAARSCIKPDESLDVAAVGTVAKPVELAQPCAGVVCGACEPILEES